MERRRFLASLAAVYAARAGAQVPTPSVRAARVGILLISGDWSGEKAFLETMRELGWVEGRSIAYDRVAADDEARLPELAAALVARNPDAIYAQANPSVLAALASTRTIPIVCPASAELVELGVVKSLARPGGNVTGISNIGWELGAKRLQVLKEMLPKVSRVGVLFSPLYPASQRELKLMEQSAPRLGVKVVPVTVKAGGDLKDAFAVLAKNHVEAVFTTHIVPYLNERKRILELATAQRVPVVGHRSEMTEDGALMSYGSVLSDQHRRAAQFLDKILRGAKPGDIPMEQPTKFELVVNLKTAKALGLKIAQSFLVRADRVIE